jgi:rare lipoprotein A (peptidoglycan hydrolase)
MSDPLQLPETASEADSLRRAYWRGYERGRAERPSFLPLVVAVLLSAMVIVAPLAFLAGRASASVPRPAPQPTAWKPVDVSRLPRASAAAQDEAPSRSAAVGSMGLGASPSPSVAPSGRPAPVPVASARGKTVHGTASWYDDGPGLYAAAGRGFHKGELVRVTFNGRSIGLRLVDVCACYRRTSRERVIDLSRDAFARLADPTRGLIRVTVTVVRS